MPAQPPSPFSNLELQVPEQPPRLRIEDQEHHKASSHKASSSATHRHVHQKKNEGVHGKEEKGNGQEEERKIEADSIMIMAEQILESKLFIGASLLAGAVAIAAVSAGVTVLMMRSSRR